MDPSSLFSGWEPLLRIVVVGLAAYVALVVMLRLSGKRTLSKLNAFDFVVTVALGSTLATVIISRETSLAEGLTALALLIVAQFAVTWTTARWGRFNRAVKSEPTVLLRRGEPIRPALRRERVTEDELLSAVRDKGGRSLDEAEAIFLEADGSLSAILSR